MWSFILGAVLWVGVVTILTAGLLGLIVDVLSNALPRRDAPDDIWEFRFKLVQLTALTTVLGAAVALPLTMARLRLTRRTNKTAEDALFNDKINEATKGLYARRQVSVLGKDGKHEDVWKDDVIQRGAAIDRLEGLAQEKPQEVPRIERLLSVYVREISAEVPAQAPPKDATPDDLRKWARALPGLRSDMEKAAQTLGRVADIAPDRLTNGEIDLRGANLQRADLRGAKLEHALLQGAKLQGAHLFEAQLKGTHLSRVQLQGANLFEAQLQRAHLSGACLQAENLGKTRLQGANLGGARLQGADLSGAQLQGAYDDGARLQGAYLAWARLDIATSLTAANTRAAALKEVDLNDVAIGPHQIRIMFGDASVNLPNGTTPDHQGWPAHWPKTELDYIEFQNAWRTWQATLPAGWDQANE